MSAFKFLIGCCKSIESVVEQPVQEALKKTITNESIICMVDQIEEKSIETIADATKSSANFIVKPIIGKDVSDTIDSVVKTVIEPTVIQATNEQILSLEKQAADKLEENIEKVRIPVLHETL